MRRDVQIVYDWKSPRRMDLFAKNTDREIKQALRDATDAKTAREAVKSRPKPKPRNVAPEVPDSGDLMAVLHSTAQGLMRGTLDVKAAGKIICSVQQMTLTR